MKKLLMACLIALSLASAPALADDYEALQSAAYDRAQIIIDGCYNISREDIESGITTTMIEGLNASTACMKKHILMLSEKFLFKNNPKMREEAEQALNNLEDGTRKFYFILNNRNDSCAKTPCGTMYRLVHAVEIEQRMSDILKDVYITLETYKQDFEQ